MFTRLSSPVLFLSFFVVASIPAQTSTLSASQADAIRAEETRWNTQDLGGYGYAKVTYEVVSVAPAKKGTITPVPKPGTIAVAVVEHLEGGKSPQPGYSPTIFWLEPQGDGWKTGFISHEDPGYIDRGDILPSAAAARAELLGKPIPGTRASGPRGDEILIMVFAVGFLVLLVGGLVWYVRRATRPKVVGSVTCVNPSCRKVVNPAQGAPCANCTSTATKVLKMPVGGGYNAVTQSYSKGLYDIVRYCFVCKTKGDFNTHCPHCGTDLRRIMIDSTS